MSLLKFKNACLAISSQANTKSKKIALATASAVMVGVANTNAVLVSGSGVILENSDLATVNSAVQSYATTSLEVFKLLWFIVIVWWVKYIITKVFWLFGWNSTN